MLIVQYFWTKFNNGLVNLLRAENNTTCFNFLVIYQCVITVGLSYDHSVQLSTVSGQQ